MKKTKKTLLAAILTLAMATTAVCGLAACNSDPATPPSGPVTPDNPNTPDNPDNPNTPSGPPASFSYKEFGKTDRFGNRGVYSYEDADGTTWMLLIEENSDHILRGEKTINGHKVSKELVGPSFDATYGTDGVVKLALASAHLYIDGEEAPEQYSQKLSADHKAWAAAYDEETENGDKIWGYINNQTYTLKISSDGNEFVDLQMSEVLPGWGGYEATETPSGPPASFSYKAFDKTDRFGNRGVYSYEDADGTTWMLLIEENSDHILRGEKIINGHKVSKELVGPSFDAVFGTDGIVKLALASAHLYIDGEEAPEQYSQKLSADHKAWAASYDEETENGDKIWAYINNQTYELKISMWGDEFENLALSEVLPGWGGYDSAE